MSFRYASLTEATNLRPEASEETMRAFLEEASAFNVRSVVVLPKWAKLAETMLATRAPRLVTVVDFPLGAGGTLAKFREAQSLLQRYNIDDIDVVWNIGAFLEGDDGTVLAELVQLHQLLGTSVNLRRGAGNKLIPAKLILKVITEIGYLVGESERNPAGMIKEVSLSSETQKRIVRSAELVRESGADYYKFATGFGPKTSLACKAAVLKVIRAAVPELPIKVAEGIGSRADIAALITAGFDTARDVIGTSNWKQILS